MSIPVMPSTHTWVQGGPILEKAGRNALYASDQEVVWVWNEDTGVQVTDLRDANGNTIPTVPIVNGRVDGVGVPNAVVLPSFSVGQYGPRFYVLPVQTLRNAAAALAPTDTQVSTLVNTGGSSTRVALDTRFVGQGQMMMDLAKQAGVDNTGTAECSAAINAALASAASLGVRAFGRGTYNIASTVIIKCDADLSAATFNYTGTGVAVQVGTDADGTVLANAYIKLPVVNYSNKPTTGWTAGTIGVKAINCNACDIYVKNVVGFETNLLAFGRGAGTAYTDFHIQSLWNGKRNLVLDTLNSGWVNSNTFDGAFRCFQNPAEGTAVSGTRQILLTSAYNFNNNLFVNPSLEGDVAEYHLDINYGAFNTFLAPRIESTTPKVRWGAQAQFNRIIGGYQNFNIVQTKVAGQIGNTIDWSDRWEFQGTSVNPSVRVAAGSAGNDALAVFAPNDINNVKRWGWNEVTLRGRGPSSTYDVISIESATGRINIGSGSAAPTMWLGLIGSSGIGINGGNLYFQADNTYDLGSAGLRPRYIYAGTALKPPTFATGSRPSASTVGAGGHIYDTTLSKPIWSDGTVWRDATGTAV